MSHEKSEAEDNAVEETKENETEVVDKEAVVEVDQTIEANENKAEVISDPDSARNEMLRKLPTPKIPPFVKSEPPCDFKENPTEWIEWLETEVGKFKEQQIAKKQKEEMAKAEAEAVEVTEAEVVPVVDDGDQDKHEMIAPEEVAEDEMASTSAKQDRIKAAAEAIAQLDQEDLEEEVSEEQVPEVPEVEAPPEAAVAETGSKPEPDEDDEGEWEWESEEEEDGGEEAKTEVIDTETPDQDQDQIENVQVTSGEKAEAEIESCDNENANVEAVGKGDESEKEIIAEASDNDKTDEKPEATEVKAEPKIPPPAPSRGASSDPMEVIEKMRQMRQNRVLQKQVSADGSTPSGFPAAPAFLRTHSNPDGSARNRDWGSRPTSFAAEDNLDDMLGRVKKLREERSQILNELAMIKDAMDEEDSKPESNNNNNKGDHSPDDGVASPPDTETASQAPAVPASSKVRSRVMSIDSGVGSKVTTDEGGSDHAGPRTKKKVSAFHKSGGQESDSIYCFICGDDLGRLTKAAAMHMGLEDGEPTCPEAFNLTEKSRQKIANIAMAKHMDLKSKHELLDTLDLDLFAGEEYEVSAQDVLNRVESFLDDIEEQKKKDVEQFDQLRAGAIDEIFAAEFGGADLMSSSILTSSYTNTTDDLDEDKTENDALSVGGDLEPHGEAFDNVVIPHDEDEDDTAAPTPVPPPGPPPPAPPPPPPAPPASTTKDKEQHLSNKNTEARSDLIQSILDHAKLKAKTVNGNSSDDEPIVQDKHLAPRVKAKEVRDLMSEIRHAPKKRKLRKTKTVDKSRPYIPKDMEIYFYAGPNASKDLAPPPASRELPSKTSPSPPPPPPEPPKPVLSFKRSKPNRPTGAG